MPKTNLVIRDKKLPHNVKNENLNWQSSTEGKFRRKEAAEHQKNIQSACNDAMIKQKQETGTTGMKDSQYRAVIGEIMERHSGRDLGRKVPSTSKVFAFRVVNGKKQLVQVAGPGV